MGHSDKVVGRCTSSEGVSNYIRQAQVNAVNGGDTVMLDSVCPSFCAQQSTVWSKKTDPLVYFDDNFGKYGPI